MENTILDHEELYPGTPESYELAGTGKRFANYLLDVLGFYIFMVLLGALGGIFMPGLLDSFVESGLRQYVIIYSVYVVYYTLMEGALEGKTLGKFVTRSRAVRDDDDPLTWQDALVRSLCRLIPFEAFSFLAGPRGWHNTISRTKVVLDQRQA